MIRLRLTTESDTVYFLDLKAMAMIRAPGPSANLLKEDGRPMPVLSVEEFEVGKPLRLMMAYGRSSNRPPW